MGEKKLFGRFAKVEPLEKAWSNDKKYVVETAEGFFELLAFYIASVQLSTVWWAQPFGKNQVDFFKRQNVEVLHWYDNMQRVVLSWYLGEWRTAKV